MPPRGRTRYWVPYEDLVGERLLKTVCWSLTDIEYMRAPRTGFLLAMAGAFKKPRTGGEQPHGAGNSQVWGVAA
jgi:hypothetical protein